jgi:hypothetical protein
LAKWHIQMYNATEISPYDRVCRTYRATDKCVKRCRKISIPCEVLL